MYNVVDIAHWFLSKQPMTHKKLQKLCYYAQAWFCALYDGAPLFEAETQAWVHGPVIPALYPMYADYRWNDIPKYTGIVADLSTEAVNILEAVQETYGDFSGDQLEALTHSEQPWIQARENLQPWETCTNVITTQSMRKFYGELYAAGQND